jgi:hypothetical protein
MRNLEDLGAFNPVARNRNADHATELPTVGRKDWPATECPDHGHAASLTVTTMRVTVGLTDCQASKISVSN